MRGLIWYKYLFHELFGHPRETSQVRHYYVNGKLYCGSCYGVLWDGEY